MPFPTSFVWGAAASSFQIEGASAPDERGRSIWDTFCATPGAVWGGHTGDVACDHCRLYKEDVALMKRMGLRAFRFSISWPRVLPHGVGAVNETGLDFYSRLVDELLGAGIQPYVTLFHWDYPESLYRRGGWLSAESPAWFGEYAERVVDRLSDRVAFWMTMNEPQVFIKFGHADGTNAPGLKLPLSDQLTAAHHTLLAHGRGAQAIRARARSTPKVGWAVVCVVKYPKTHGTADVEIARRATCGVAEPTLWNNTWWNDPLYFARYPEDGIRLFDEALRRSGGRLPTMTDADAATIGQKLDYLGLNIYEGQPVRAGANGQPEVCERPIGHPMTAFRWPVEPESLYWGPRFMHERYGVPVYITENGLSSMDWISLDGKVHDSQRIDFTHRYLLALRRAAEDGVPVSGYFHWTLMDNFEWSAGYRERFGLVYVDYATQARLPKDSAHWYRRVIETNGAEL